MGQQILNVRKLSGSQTLRRDDDIVIADNSSGAASLALPPITSQDAFSITVIPETLTIVVNTVTINAGLIDGVAGLIRGVASMLITGRMTLYCAKGKWYY